MKAGIQKVILSCLVLLLLSFTASASDFPEQITVAMRDGENLPYQNQIIEGQKKGIYVDIAEAAAKKIGVTIIFKAYPWKRCLVMVERGTVDGVLGVLKNKKLRESIYFVEEPLAFEETTLFTYKGSNVRFNGNLKDINQYRVGIIRGATFYEEWENNKKKIIKIEEVNQIYSLIKTLSAKRIDLIIGNKFIIQYKLKQLNLNNDVIVVDPSLALNSGHLAFTRGRGESHKALAKAFNKAIEEIKKTDMYMNILNKYDDL